MLLMCLRQALKAQLRLEQLSGSAELTTTEDHCLQLCSGFSLMASFSLTPPQLHQGEEIFLLKQQLSWIKVQTNTALTFTCQLG